MNIDRILVNRALAKAGQNPLTETDITNNSTVWQAVKLFYLSTMLETLATTEWTGAKRRATLTEKPIEVSNLNNNYSYMYLLPSDCAKPIRIQDNDEYVIEGTYLYTNRSNAVLLYITNGRIASEDDYITDDDYPEYNTETYESSFWEYIETRLASKFVLRLTGENSLYQLLFSESQVIEQKAQKASRAQAASKPKGNAWWGDTIGMA